MLKFSICLSHLTLHETHIQVRESLRVTSVTSVRPPWSWSFSVFLKAASICRSWDLIQWSSNNGHGILTHCATHWTPKIWIHYVLCVALIHQFIPSITSRDICHWFTQRDSSESMEIKDSSWKRKKRPRVWISSWSVCLKPGLFAALLFTADTLSCKSHCFYPATKSGYCPGTGLCVFAPGWPLSRPLLKPAALSAERDRGLHFLLELLVKEPNGLERKAKIQLGFEVQNHEHLFYLERDLPLLVCRCSTWHVFCLLEEQLFLNLVAEHRDADELLPCHRERHTLTLSLRGSLKT